MINQNYLYKAPGPLQIAPISMSGSASKENSGRDNRGSLPHQKLQPVEFCSQNLGIGVHRWQGKRELSSSWDWD